MSSIDKDGMLVDKKVIFKRFPSIEHGDLVNISGLLIHQTDSPTAQHTFNAYHGGGNGAHFLIAKTGEIYQTASTKKRCYHVGRRIKSKCLTINPTTCDKAAMQKIQAMSWSNQVKAIDSHERTKNYPDRYPTNSESIGIELVGQHIDDKNYEAVTPLQNASLKWLVKELYNHFSLSSADVYRHPDVSYKNPGEASSAAW